ncbi:hypothetical protein HAV15_001531 [Penicillium sp. str. |nr:hypothetical protein HAV15_001531 [Penicillium sp. str. \
MFFPSVIACSVAHLFGRNALDIVLIMPLSWWKWLADWEENGEGSFEGPRTVQPGELAQAPSAVAML